MKKNWPVMSLITAAFIVGLFGLIAGRAEAVCGASVSSCKSCHEVRREIPVAQLGAWHSDHSFSDFCEFCHGGSVKATEKGAAHQGLREPYADPVLSCGNCHGNDLETRLAKYGVTVDASSLKGAMLPAGSDNSGTGSPPTAGKTGPKPGDTGGKDLLDYNRVLAETRPEPVNWGNRILILINILVAIFFGYLLWSMNREKKQAVAENPAGRLTGKGEGARL